MNYRHTRLACFAGYIVQAIVINFPPLLFVFFHEQFGIALDAIGSLVTVTFLLQLCIDFLAGQFAEKMSYRFCAVLSQLCSGVGMILLGILPRVMSHSYAAILIAAFFYSIGGGLIEVIISPMIEACPSDNKSGQMSLLHSFYCWGQAGTVLLSTLLFALFGIGIWPVLSCLWAIVPLVNAWVFCRVPVPELRPEGGAMAVGKLLRQPVFWIMAVMMVCAGASELAMSQWASAFAERGLGVSKTLGDLLGPCLFAVMMGLSRVCYAFLSEKHTNVLEKAMTVCTVTCAVGYLMATLAGGTWIPLAGCALVGLSVGLFWPGTFSIASVRCPAGGTAMFALLALGGDLGCSIGPYLVGAVSNAAGENLSAGLLAAIVFPLILFAAISMGKKASDKK